jgi:hypothetical protein
MARVSKARLVEIELGLKSHIKALAQDLFPKGFVLGPKYFPLNHTRGDRHPGSMYIHIEGPKVGGWWEAATDEKGAVLALVAYAKGWDMRTDFRRVITFCENFLALGPEVPKNMNTARGHKPLPVFSAEETAKFVMGLWLQGEKELSGTLAARYFSEHRGIDLQGLPRPPGALRFDGACRYYTAPQTYHKQPAIVSMMINERLQPSALHRTYLTEGGAKYESGRKDMSAKKILGRAKGAFIPLSRGGNGLRLREALNQGVCDDLAITEGIEDGLSVAQVFPEWRVWAAGTLGNIANMPWPDIAPRVHIVAQNDDHPQAIETFNKAVNVLSKSGAGREIIVHRPPSHIKDINDWLRGLLNGR